MTMNVPAGARLRALRERRDLSQDEMARALGINHRQTIAQIEAGERKLSAADLVAAVRAFGVPLEYFTDPFMIVGEARFSWRRDENVELGNLDDFEAMAGAWLGAYRELSRQLGQDLPLVLPKLSLSLGSRFEDAELAAERLVAKYDLGPVPSRQLAEFIERDLSTLVLMIDAKPGISGAACLVGDLAAVLVNRRENPGRRNFDLAHELFHILTWDAMPPDHVEGYEPSGKRKRAEQMANAFASALLMPRSVLAGLEGDATDPEWLNEAATRLGVSSVALKWRLVATGRLRKDDALAIGDDLLRNNGGRWNETADAPPAFSRRFIAVIASAIDEGAISVRRASALLDMTIDELQELCDAHGVEREFDL